MAFTFPGDCDANLVADAAFAAAYDALAPEERAAVKTAIARMAAVHGTEDAVSGRCSRVMRQGFRLHAASRPAPWAVVLWDEAYAGPTRVLAALVPAMLAGVPDILACRVRRDGAPFPQPLLAALELAGQELVMDASPEDAAGFVTRCCEADPRGRLVLLGRDPVFETISRLAAERGTPVLRYAAPVRIGIPAGSVARPAPGDGLCFAQPDADLISFEGEASPGAFAAIFCAEGSAAEYLEAAPLVLCPGNEAYWAWPGLGRDFYRETSLGLSGVDPD
ncbi:conserved hypothetical protein [uncultured delta proteobacterium]|uniref:Uncharacterized protein n=1 Tax=uncultured delta proteobacterium TaxID=34034 RepID=A0A212JDE6_9DELT|nr:conserved hypothetical protein [uncultured delta proteobacterium]